MLRPFLRKEKRTEHYNAVVAPAKSLRNFSQEAVTHRQFMRRKPNVKIESKCVGESLGKGLVLGCVAHEKFSFHSSRIEGVSPPRTEAKGHPPLPNITVQNSTF